MKKHQTNRKLGQLLDNIESGDTIHKKTMNPVLNKILGYVLGIVDAFLGKNNRKNQDCVFDQNHPH